jgi:hypothetical protein
MDEARFGRLKVRQEGNTATLKEGKPGSGRASASASAMSVVLNGGRYLFYVQQFEQFFRRGMRSEAVRG